MELKGLLQERRSAIVAAWFETLVESYQEEARGPLRKQNAPFTNPVGFNAGQGLEGLLDGLLKGLMPSETSRFLDGIVRIRNREMSSRSPRPATNCTSPSCSSKT